MPQKLPLVLPILALSLLLSAGNQDALDAFTHARDKERAGQPLTAADWYNEAQVQADDPVIKANALMNMARCYRRAGKYGAEFDCLQKLVKGHMNRISYSDVVSRQYEIADEFFRGHRDYFVSWLPFVKLDDRTSEMFRTVLENAPCSPSAPETRLRLGRIYIEEQHPEKAIKEFMETIKLHPETMEAKYASLELANVLLQLSERGDGDGKYARDAIDAFDEFLKKHPNDPEIKWVERAREQVRCYIAERYRKLGEFYNSQGKPEIAQRYLAMVVQDYPNTPDTPKAEKLLSKLDHEFQASGAKWTPAERQFKMMSLPKEEAPVMVIPSESGGRWLLPVRDLKAGIVQQGMEDSK